MPSYDVTDPWEGRVRVKQEKQGQASRTAISVMNERISDATRILMERKLCLSQHQSQWVCGGFCPSSNVHLM